MKVVPPVERSADAGTPAPRSPLSPRFAEKGVVRKLCDEIGFSWDERLERVDVLVAFVSQLVGEIDFSRAMQERIGSMGGKAPSEGSAEALAAAKEMLAGTDRAELIERAASLHDACDRLNPEDAYPTDHLIDMLSSCASAIRFGLELPCMSRHAAAACSHVWKQVYGVSRFDSCTPAWEHDWARRKLTEALISLLPPDAARTEQVEREGSREE